MLLEIFTHLVWKPTVVEVNKVWLRCDSLPIVSVQKQKNGLLKKKKTKKRN